MQNYRARLFQMYLVVAVLAFAALMYFARIVPHFDADVGIEQAIQSISAPWFASLMAFVSWLGFLPQALILMGVIVAVIALLGWRWGAVMALAAGLGGWLIGEALKNVVQRARPTADLVNVAGILHDYSFPSVHTLTFTAFLGFVLFLTYTLYPPSRVRTVVMVALGTLIALVGVSRVYMGQHWPSDVLGAYLLGSLWLVVVIYMFRWGRGRSFRRVEG